MSFSDPDYRSANATEAERFYDAMKELHQSKDTTGVMLKSMEKMIENGQWDLARFIAPVVIAHSLASALHNGMPTWNYNS